MQRIWFGSLPLSGVVNQPTMTDIDGLDPEELARRLRHLSRDLPTLARRSGLPVETVRQVLHGQIIPSDVVRDRLLRALTA